MGGSDPERITTVRIRKVAVGVGVATVLVVGGSGVAGADHTHSLQTGNGSCVLLAQNGGEGNVQLPFASGPENRRHPLHVLVHTAEPGQHVDIGVQGTDSDPCPDAYLND